MDTYSDVMVVGKYFWLLFAQNKYIKNNKKQLNVQVTNDWHEWENKHNIHNRQKRVM